MTVQGVSGGNVHGVNPATNQAAKGLISPADIMEYITMMLTDVDGQLHGFKAEAEKRNEAATSMRELAELMRKVKDNPMGKNAQECWKIRDEFKALAAKTNDPEVKALISEWQEKTFPVTLDSNGKPYIHNKVGTSGAKKEDYEEGLKDIDGRLASLNTDNEFTMMSLSSLMQFRTRTTQFSSNVMGMLNDSMKSVISNTRA